MKYNDEVKQYSKTVYEYLEGIQLVKQKNPHEAEITID